jgi:hypothetical protein
VDSILPHDTQQAELDKPGEQGVQSGTVQIIANSLSNLGPCQANGAGLGDKRDDEISDGHMLSPLAITTLDPGRKIDGIHLRVCMYTSHLL